MIFCYKEVLLVDPVKVLALARDMPLTPRGKEPSDAIRPIPCIGLALLFCFRNCDASEAILSSRLSSFFDILSNAFDCLVEIGVSA